MKQDFPFDDLDRLIDEEENLPFIPPFPSIWKLKTDTETDENLPGHS